MPYLEVNNLKGLREDLLKAESALAEVMRNNLPPAAGPETRSVIRRLDALVTQIDQLRPLGPNGKHGERHTPWCGCEDIPNRPTPAMRYDPERRQWINAGVVGQHGEIPEETTGQYRVRTLKEEGCKCFLDEKSGEIETRNPFCPLHGGVKRN